MGLNVYLGLLVEVDGATSIILLVDVKVKSFPPYKYVPTPWAKHTNLIQLNLTAASGPDGDIDSAAARAPRQVGPTPNLVVSAANVLEVYAVRADDATGARMWGILC
jgi:hypothetical protein